MQGGKGQPEDGQRGEQGGKGAERMRIHGEGGRGVYGAGAAGKGMMMVNSRALAPENLK